MKRKSTDALILYEREIQGGELSKDFVLTILFLTIRALTGLFSTYRIPA